MNKQENITHQKLTIKTPHYITPKQFQPTLKNISPYTNIYSTKTILYHTLNNHPPFKTTTTHTVLIKTTTQKPPKLIKKITPSKKKIPTDVTTIINYYIKKIPKKHYKTNKTLTKNINTFLKNNKITTNPLNNSKKLQHKITQNKSTITLFKIISLILLIIIKTSITTIIITNKTYHKINTHFETISKIIKSTNSLTINNKQITTLNNTKSTLDTTNNTIDKNTKTTLIPNLITSNYTLKLILTFT